MSFKSIVRGLRDGIGSMSMQAGCGDGGGRAAEVSPDRPPPPPRRRTEKPQLGRWGDLPAELLRDVMQRVESGGEAWPARRDVVACASVCRSWRETIQAVVQTAEQCARITFPISLKQPGPRNAPIQCYVRRERAAGMFCLYLGLSPVHGENGKLLLAARRIRRAAITDYLISLVSDDFSKASSTYIGKLRSNLLGSKFTIYDGQPPYDATALSNRHSSRRIHSRKVSPRVPAGNYSIGAISYEFNLLRTRGPRRLQCTMHSIPASAVQDDGTAPTPTSFLRSLDEQFSALSVVKPKDPQELSSMSLTELLPVPTMGEPLVLKNKAPRWHEQLQCWCLNFRGRVTVASVKNFQLVAAVDPSHPGYLAEQDRVILQFGKIGKDIFTMDYRYPLSAFQAFAICLSSFNTKLVCE